MTDAGKRALVTKKHLTRAVISDRLGSSKRSPRRPHRFPGPGEGAFDSGCELDRYAAETLQL